MYINMYKVEIYNDVGHINWNICNEGGIIKSPNTSLNIQIENIIEKYCFSKISNDKNNYPIKIYYLKNGCKKNIIYNIQGFTIDVKFNLPYCNE